MDTIGQAYPQYEALLDYALLWFMSVLRLAGTFMTAPFYGSNLLPMRVRLLLIASFAFVLLPTAANTAALPAQADGLDLILIAGQEAMIGLSLGLLCSVVFYAAQLAGELVGQQIGLSMANVMDPLTEQEVPLIGTLQMNIATLVFVLAKLDLVVVWLHVVGFRLIGVGQLTARAFIAPTTEVAFKQVDQLYWIGLQIAIPVMTVMLLASVLEGYITRTMPQMNIMVLGVPLKLVVGLFALTLTVPGVARVVLPGEYDFNLTEYPDGPFGEMLFTIEDWIYTMADRLQPAEP